MLTLTWIMHLSGKSATLMKSTNWKYKSVKSKLTKAEESTKSKWTEQKSTKSKQNKR